MMMMMMVVVLVKLKLNLLTVTSLALWVEHSRRNWLSKTAKFLGGKSANELMYSL